MPIFGNISLSETPKLEEWVICPRHKVVLKARHCDACGHGKDLVKVVRLSVLKHEEWRAELWMNRAKNAAALISNGLRDGEYPDLADWPEEAP